MARSAKPPNTKICPGRKVSPRTASWLMIEEAIGPKGDDTEELSMKAPMSVSKPVDLEYGVPNCASRRMVTGDKGHDVFTQVRALSVEVEPYSCLINIDGMGITRVDLPRDQRG